jgi:hypothetical protein
MWHITVFTILLVTSVHTLAFSWRRHDPSELFPGAERTVPQDLVYPGLHLSSRKTGYPFSVSHRHWAR